MVPERGFKVRALGEIAIRVQDMEVMVAFYRDILGLEILSRRDGDRIVFFRISDGFAGHTTVLALFRDDEHEGAETPLTGERRLQSSLHHLALTISRDEQDAAINWYEAKGIACRVQTFPWIGWRGVFVNDPEGNTVELVAYDDALQAE